MARKPGLGPAFEKALFQACGKCGWLLHAYVIMNNHYHLALETPQPNLVDGMRWLQGTFSIRFNAFHGERGHVFQSRDKSLVIEDGRLLLGLSESRAIKVLLGSRSIDAARQLIGTDSDAPTES